MDVYRPYLMKNIIIKKCLNIPERSCLKVQDVHQKDKKEDDISNERQEFFKSERKS